jgi:Reverse transcriptase (RNA-dependent DNA polymerase)
MLHPDAHTMAFFQREGPTEPGDVVAAVMTQLSLKVGLKRWGEKAKEAAYSEMKQLHFRDTFTPLRWKDLTESQRKTVLESHMFLKEKRDGKIKGQTVAGGNKQRDYMISKEDASSPTVATEAVLLTCIIDAEEGRDVAVIDIPNTFIQTKIGDEADMAMIKIRFILAEMLVDIAPDVYKDFMTTDKKGTKQLIVRCKNAIYGTMVASLLYYRKFSKCLIDKGFKFNPYNPCVANKMIDGHQMTICFHVDDCKLSHKSPKAMDDMTAWLKDECENIFEDGTGKMTVSRGKVHRYLGMTLDYSTPGQISMFDYINEILAAFEAANPRGLGSGT